MPVRKTGESRSRKSSGGGFLRALVENVIGPLGLVLLGVGIVLVIGWYVTSEGFKLPVRTGKVAAPDAGQTGTPPAQQPSGQTGQPPAQQPAPPPSQETGSAPAPDEATIRVQRQQINRAGSEQAMKIVAYYVDGLTNAQTIQPIEMMVPVDKGRIRATVDHLINAPRDLKLFSEFPAGTTVLGANLRDGVAIVDLSRELLSVRGSAASTAIQYVLVYSLTEIEGVNAVLLRVQGHPAQLDQIVWDQPVTRQQLEKRNAYSIAPLLTYQGR
jgi:spore germination protein GerM